MRLAAARSSRQLADRDFFLDEVTDDKGIDASDGTGSVEVNRPDRMPTTMMSGASNPDEAELTERHSAHRSPRWQSHTSSRTTSWGWSHQSHPRRPIPGPIHAKPRPAEIVADHLGKAGVIFNEQNSVGHRRILAATPAMPEAPALPKLGQAIIDLAPLLRCQDFRCVAKCLREALARRVASASCSVRSVSMAARSTVGCVSSTRPR